MSDEELEAFVETVEGNEETITRLVELEAEIAKEAHNQLDEDRKSELAISDLLPKVDDAVDRIWDWWVTHDADRPEFGTSLR